MSQQDIEISNLSYTSKDFGQMYPEVLDLAKQLTNEWDPSSSNESDPGVVLLKEAAFVADHNNYNIDKNILENFLPSATQDRSVRNITEMNGYTPRYYVSATGNVSFKWKLSTEDENYSTIVKGFTIPRYSIILANENDTVAYTQWSDLIVPPTESATISAKFIEGTLETLTVNGSSKITLENLDDNNRLYFTEAMVAENGVIVENISTTDSVNEWTRNNFLLTQPKGTRCYKVDYDSIQGLPYIEFPSDISNLIGEGITIKYVATSGSKGNISAKTLSKIASPSSFTITDIEGNKIDVTIDYFTNISNVSSFSNGKDPETINEMYRSFKHFVGTFDTLVTPLDYTNCIYSANNGDNYIISNGFVTDKRNDYNKALNVLTCDEVGNYFKNISVKPCTLTLKASESACSSIGDMYVNAADNKLYVLTQISPVKTWIDTNKINLNDFAILTEAMTPYDLVIYGLSLLGNFDSNDYGAALKNSFTPINSTASTGTLQQLKDVYIANNKTLCHTYKDPDNASVNGTSVVPGSGDIYTFKVKTPLNVNLYTYNKITELERDSILVNIYKYLTDKLNPREIEFGEELDLSAIKQYVIESDSRVKDADVSIMSTGLYAMYKTGDNTSIEEPLMPTTNAGSTLITLVAKNVISGRLCLFNFYDDFNFDYYQVNGKIINNIKSLSSEVKIPVTYKQVSDTRSTQSVSRLVFTSTGSNIRYTSTQVIAAESEVNLLDTDTFSIKITNDGVESEYTFKPENGYTYTVRNNSIVGIEKSVSDYKSFTGSGDITVTQGKTLTAVETTVNNLNYTLKENECVQIIYPNFYSKESYSAYIYYRYEGTSNISANTEHTLKIDERIILMYTKDGIETTTVLSPGTTIRSSFILTPTTGGTEKSWQAEDGTISSARFKQIPSGQTIDTRVMLSTKLTSANTRCYWSVNNETNTLFTAGEDLKILNSNEYFIYTNTAFTEFIVLGAGTKLVRTDTSTAWSIDKKISIETITANGINSLIDAWKILNFSEESPFIITEMNVITLEEGDTLVIDNCTSSATDWNISNSWQDISAIITYIQGGESNTLYSIDDFYKIRSRLNFNSSKDNPQKLVSKNQIVQLGTSVDNKIIGDDKNPVYIQASPEILSVGESTISLVKTTDFYVYNMEKATANKAIPITQDGSASYTLSILNSGALQYKYILPVYVYGKAIPIKVELKNATTGAVIKICDYNSIEQGSYADYLDLQPNQPTFITFDESKFSSQTKAILKFTWTGTTAEKEVLYVRNPKLVAPNSRSGYSSEELKDFDANSLREKIKELIKNSDTPSVKFNYAYELDNTVAINTEKYSYTDANNKIVGPFNNPEVMWDPNNVANFMTIQEVDLSNSKFTVDRSMRNY